MTRTQGDYQDPNHRRKPNSNINPKMKKLRKVPPRFFENKTSLMSKFKILGIEDENNWTESKGEGTTYGYLLKLPIYNESDQLPENMFRRDSEIVYEERPISWDKYFEAIQQNAQVGFTSKYNKNSRKPVEVPKQTYPSAAEIYSDNIIEWDNIQEAESADKKYKMQFKEISDNEKTEIMKKIDTDDVVPNHLQMKKQGMPENPQIISAEQLEKNIIIDVKPMSFFNDKDEEENQLAISKENNEVISETTEEIVIEPTEIDVSKITRVEDIEAVANSSPIIKEETIQNEKQVEPSQIISVEDIEKKQMATQSIETPPIAVKTIVKPTSNKSSVPSNNQNPMQFQAPLNSPSPNQIQQWQQMQQMQQMQEYMRMQNEIETQKMIEKLNQEEIKKVMMQNPNLIMDSRTSSVSPTQNINPFEPILRDNPTSTWLYKDPQGFVRGPFT